MPENTAAMRILLVEDNEDDVFLMRQALRSAGILNPMRVVEDGQEAIDYLAGAGKFADRKLYPFPGLLFLDLKLPRKSGFDVLEWIDQHAELPRPVIVVLSSSNSPRDRERVLALGAAHYAIKPPVRDLFQEIAQMAGLRWELAAGALGSAPVTAVS
jgi:CheY-like chemotaxis protein